MKIEYQRIITKEDCRIAQDKIFVFGDNLVKRGTGGQAVIRYEPNAFGIPTKRLPSMVHDSFFSDKEDEEYALKQSLRELYKLGCLGKIVVFPTAGIGTGRANMREKSPMLYATMCDILFKHFGIVNGELK